MNIDRLFKEAIESAEAEKELFEFLHARFLYLARRKIGNKEDCEEVVQSVLLSIFDNFRQIDIDKGYAPWAYRILQNRIIDYYRTHKHSTSLEPIFENSKVIADAPMLKLKLLECLKKINRAKSTHARILVLRYQGFDFDEICDKLKLNKKNAYSVLSRARSLLLYCLEKGKLE